MNRYVVMWCVVYKEGCQINVCVCTSICVYLQVCVCIGSAAYDAKDEQDEVFALWNLKI